MNSRVARMLHKVAHKRLPLLEGATNKAKRARLYGGLKRLWANTPARQRCALRKRLTA